MPNTIGYRVYYSTSLPATNDKAGFEALSWSATDGLVQAPQFGTSHSGIDIPDLLTGFTRSVKGAATGNDTQMQFHVEDGTTGHDDLRAQAEDDDGVIALKLVKDGSGTDGAPAAGDDVEYAQGYLHSFVRNQGTVSAYEGFTVNFRQNDFTIEDVEPT